MILFAGRGKPVTAIDCLYDIARDEKWFRHGTDHVGSNELGDPFAFNNAWPTVSGGSRV